MKLIMTNPSEWAYTCNDGEINWKLSIAANLGYYDKKRKKNYQYQFEGRVFEDENRMFLCHENNDSIFILQVIQDLTFIKIPETINGKVITNIHERAFSQLKNVTKLFISKSINEINKVIFPKSLFEISVDQENNLYCALDGSLFNSEKTELYSYPAAQLRNEYKIPQGVKYINSRAFQGNKYIADIVIPESIKEIKHHAFADCSSLQTVNIPEGVISLGDLAFQNCKKIQEIYLPSSLTAFGWGVFNECDQLMRINVSPLSNYLKDIDGVLFSKDGRYLIKYPAGIIKTEYHVPEGVETIAPGAFFDKVTLERIYLPETIVTLSPWSINKNIEITIKKNIRFLTPETLKNSGNGNELIEYLMKQN